jgi:hippurate hydrolase
MTTETRPIHPLLEAALAGLPEVVAVRRRLHAVPEVGLQLPLTQALVGEALRDLGLEPRFGTSVSSVVATIEGSGPGRTVSCGRIWTACR